MAFGLMTLAGMKHEIAKRLRYIRSEDYMGPVEDTIPQSRHLLSYNTP